MITEVDGSRSSAGDRSARGSGVGYETAGSPAVCRPSPEPFGDEDFAAIPELVKGYIGPVRFGSSGEQTAAVLGEESITKIRYLVDPRDRRRNSLGDRGE